MKKASSYYQFQLLDVPSPSAFTVDDLHKVRMQQRMTQFPSVLLGFSIARTDNYFSSFLLAVINYESLQPTAFIGMGFVNDSSCFSFRLFSEQQNSNRCLKKAFLCLRKKSVALWFHEGSPPTPTQAKQMIFIHVSFSASRRSVTRKLSSQKTRREYIFAHSADRFFFIHAFASLDSCWVWVGKMENCLA